MPGTLYFLNVDLLNVKYNILHRADKETLLSTNQFPALRNSMFYTIFVLSSATYHVKTRLIFAGHKGKVWLLVVEL